MKKHFITGCIVTLFIIGCENKDSKKEETAVTADTTTASTETTNETYPVLDSATMMKNWMAYMAPGDVHKMIASWDGTWDGEVTMWQAPGAPPQTSKSTAKNKTIFGGRYQVSNHTGNMMGQPFEGMSTLAYDNAKKVFISTWIDNMGTGIMTMQGPWDESTKSISFTGKSVDPSSGTGKEMDIRETVRIIDDKTQTMEMYGPGPDGKEFKMMEIKFTKK
ncbi:MAG TPA: DUF1579 domain-containing protein [Ferruginibacter sp.]|nr:DUF1579 domain-containing protein [Ferruginibacter sp.]